MSMRAAIDRILQQPNLVGIDTPKLKETAYIERMETPVAVRRPTEAHLDPKVQWSRVIVGSNAHALIHRTQTPSIQRQY